MRAVAGVTVNRARVTTQMRHVACCRGRSLVLRCLSHLALWPRYMALALRSGLPRRVEHAR